MRKLAFREPASAEKERAGEDAPLVLLHGFAQSARSWEGVRALLAESTGRLVVAYEFAGHGAAARPADKAEYAMDAVCDGLLAYLASFSAPPAVVGYSMGGRIALAALCRWSVLDERLPPASALVLESAGLGPADAAEREALERRNCAWAARLRAEGLEAFMDYWETLPLFATQRTLPVAVRKRVRAGRLANDAEALARTLEGTGAHRMPYRHEVLRALGKLRDAGVSVSYITGALDEKHVARSDCLPATVVPCAGHSVHLEAPQKFAQAVAEALAGGGYSSSTL